MMENTQNYDNLDNVSVSRIVEETLGKVKLLKDPNSIFAEDAYSELTDTIDLLTVSPDPKSYQESTEQTLSWDEVRQCAKWALDLWNEGLAAERWDKMLVASLVVDYLKCPVELLRLDNDNEKRKRIALKVSSLQLNLSLLENADYADHSQFRQYSEGVRDKDLGKLLSFFAALERGRGIHSFNHVPEKLINLIYKIHPDGIMALLGKGEPTVAELVIQSLPNDQIATILAESYNSEHEFPLARGFVILAKHYNDALKHDRSIIISYEQLGAIFGKLEQRETWDTTFSQLSNINVLKWNPIFHYCCGLLVVKKPDFINRYLEVVDFSLEENDYGSSFCQAIFNSDNKEVLPRVAALITEKYFSYLKDSSEQHEYILNRATGYLNLIFFHLRIATADVDGYIDLVTKNFSEVETALYSWFPHQTAFHLQVLYYVIAANFVLGFELKTEEPIVKRIESFLQDERHAHLLSDVKPETLIKLLTNPSDIERVVVVNANGRPFEFRRNIPKAEDIQ